MPFPTAESEVTMRNTATTDRSTDSTETYKLELEDLKKHFPVNTGIISRIFRGESNDAV